MDWIEVSLTVNGELAEAVAEVLARYSENGVVTEQGVRNLNDEDEGTASGPITVRAYLPADDRLEQTRDKVEDALHFLGMIQDLPEPTFRRVAEQNWMEAWKRHYRPIPIGRRLIVLPTWMESPDPTRIAIRINPGMAFGTGTHPSTQLCLQLIEAFMDPQRSRTAGEEGQPAGTLIDVGCGSGILAIAGLRLGAASALAVDIDPAAVRNARDNAAANGIGSELILAVGSIADILTGKFAYSAASLVVANILAPVIVRLLGEGLPQLLNPGGLMVLAGILDTQVREVEQAATGAGLVTLQKAQMGEWVAVGVSR